MFRGAERHVKNSCGETAYQMAINSGNLQLAAMIESFSQEDVGKLSFWKYYRIA
jgi:hypothetical protein